MDKTDDELLAEAQDRDRRHLEAWAQYQEIFSRGHIGPVWSIAAVQVAMWNICMGEYGTAEATAKLVLDTDCADPDARRTAAVVWCEARDYQDLSVDEAYLRDATEACLAAADSFFAAMGRECWPGFVWALATAMPFASSSIERSSSLSRLANWWQRSGA